jgi:hypothetical protein
MVSSQRNSAAQRSKNALRSTPSKLKSFAGFVTATVALSVRRVRWRMTISFARHQFPPEIIRHAVWLYVRFTLSYRDVEDLLAERGLDVSYETVRRWVLKFGPLFARELRRRRPRPTSTWHLDEMAVVIAGRQFWLWPRNVASSSASAFILAMLSRKRTATSWVTGSISPRGSKGFDLSRRRWRPERRAP